MKAGLNIVLVASACLLTIGAAAIVVKRSAVLMLIGSQLMLAAGGLAFVAFARFGLGAVNPYQGAAVALFAGFIGIAELAVAGAMALVIYRDHGSLLTDEYESVAD